MPENISNTDAHLRDIYNVTRLNREVRAVLEGSFPPIWLQAEISNLAQPASGHIYFSLKDEDSQIRCAMFRNKNRSLRFNPENGMSVLVHANVSLYEDRGEFQLIIDHMEPAGDGALQRAFEALKQRLYEEGLFSNSHKQIIPTAPKAIGVITSPSGAAIRDILSILQRRFPLTNVIIYPTAVQGEEAEGQILKMLKIAETRKECDVLILARGGGSLEDLWVFNNENVARSIYKCTIPIVAGIGHEIDFTIADFVADERAATPSAAAELVSPEQIQIKQQLTMQNEKLLQLINYTIDQHRQYIIQLGKRVPHPSYQLQTLIQRLDHLQQRMSHSTYVTINTNKMRLSDQAVTLSRYSPAQSLQLYSERYEQTRVRLKHAIQYKLQQFNNKLSNLSRTLDVVSPLASLNRGYAIVSKLDNNDLVRDAKQLNKGDTILTRFAKGRVHSTINKIIKKNE